MRFGFRELLFFGVIIGLMVGSYFVLKKKQAEREQIEIDTTQKQYPDSKIDWTVPQAMLGYIDKPNHQAWMPDYQKARSALKAVYNKYRYVEPMRHALQAWADRLDEILTATPAEVIPMRTESGNRRAVGRSAGRRRRG